MKTKTIIPATLLAIALAGCAQMGGNTSLGNSNLSAGAESTTSMLGGLLQTATSGSNLTNMIASVIGLDKMSKADLVGTWHYAQPGCAFTTEQTLAKAGGEAVAANLKEKLAPTYNRLGISSKNTEFTFNEDGTFVATFLGHNIQGNYSFNEKDQSIQLQTLLISFNGYMKRNTDGIALLFESKKILQILQTVGSASGNQTLSTISELSQSYDGVRIGFDLKK